MKRLIGRIIHKITMGESPTCQRDSITFHTDDGDFVYDAYGDCCSTSYIHEISDRHVLNGHKVINIVQHEADEFRDVGTAESLQVYNYDIVTNKGTCTIDFRNESNGYYGGSLEFREHIKPKDAA
jgi:hypothetical protein